jgi:serine/threonine protein phosphatase PrpC
MGDTLYYGPNRSGVIAEPEVASYRLDQNDKHIIIGSDGLWDRLSSQEAVEIVRSCPSVEHASERLTQLARERWRRHGPVADDITAVVVSFQ